jgi:hypothetical protein
MSSREISCCSTPETRSRQLPARAPSHETHPRSLDTLARVCPSSRPWWLGSTDDTLHVSIRSCYSSSYVTHNNTYYDRKQHNSKSRESSTTIKLELCVFSGVRIIL